jgi:tRNA-dihydrouridine synthase
MAESAVDAVMLGRGILGNLWLVRQASVYLTTGERIPDLDWLSSIGLVRRHAGLVLEWYGPERGPRLLRKFIAWGLHGFRGASRLRQMVNTIERPADVEALLAEAERIDPASGGLEAEDSSLDCLAVA